MSIETFRDAVSEFKFSTIFNPANILNVNFTLRIRPNYIQLYLPQVRVDGHIIVGIEVTQNKTRCFVEVRDKDGVSHPYL